MKIIQENKKAFFDYEILEKFEAGLVLSGPEIKSVRLGHVNLKGSFISIINQEAFLKGANISRYPFDSDKDYDPFRIRKLLLKKNEIMKIEDLTKIQRATVVPLVIGLKGRLAKLIIGVARGKKKYDKRQTIKERDQKRKTDRLIKNYR